jgi:quercetin dioxygenase-like cupin family protein
MRMLAALPLALLVAVSFVAQAAPAESSAIVITHGGGQPSVSAPQQYFTGTVRIDPLFQPVPPSRVSAGLVTFEPGARTAWHTHPLGQTLIVTAGKGWVQEWGHEKREIVAGDVVTIPPGVKHWHGATATTGVSHIAIQESEGGRNVDWLEKVTDDQYGR